MLDQFIIPLQKSETGVYVIKMDAPLTKTHMESIKLSFQRLIPDGKLLILDNNCSRMEKIPESVFNNLGYVKEVDKK